MIHKNVHFRFQLTIHSTYSPYYTKGSTEPNGSEEESGKEENQTNNTLCHE